MIAVGGFDRDDDHHGKDLGAGEGAIVDDLHHAGPGIRNRSGELGNAARAIAHPRREPPDTAIRGQPVVDHPPQDRKIDVAAADQEHHPPPHQLRTGSPE